MLDPIPSRDLPSRGPTAASHPPATRTVPARRTGLRVHVEGRVNAPGPISLPAGAALLQALTAAGALASDPAPARCSVVRAGEPIIWIELRDLLGRGNMTWNLPLAEGDAVRVYATSDLRHL